MSDRVTGQQPSVDNWTTHVPSVLRRMKMSDYVHSGKSRLATPTSEEEGFGYTVHSRKPRRKAGMEDDLEFTRSTMRARFDGESINEASLSDLEFINNAEYDYAFAPRKSSMIAYLEYASKHRLLRAIFKNNEAVTVYGGVPMNVYAKLMYVENSGGSVGGAFWDAIRIYERRNLPVGGPYYPKTSNFVRKGSKYPFLYTEAGFGLGKRSSKYAPTLRHEEEAEGLAQQIIEGVDETGKLLSPEEIRYKVRQIKKLRDGEVSKEILDKIERQFKAESTAQQREYELMELMDASTELGGEVFGEDSGFHVGKGSQKTGKGDILSQIEALNPEDPNFTSKRAALFDRLLKQQERDMEW